MRIIGSLLAILGGMMLWQGLAWKFNHLANTTSDNLSGSFLGMALGLVLLIVGLAMALPKR
jgi:hypothetical protein